MQACSFVGAHSYDVPNGAPTLAQSEISNGNANPILSLTWLFLGKNA
jgi:hypothetical protein